MELPAKIAAIAPKWGWGDHTIYSGGPRYQGVGTLEVVNPKWSDVPELLRRSITAVAARTERESPPDNCFMWRDDEECLHVVSLWDK